MLARPLCHLLPVFCLLSVRLSKENKKFRIGSSLAWFDTHTLFRWDIFSTFSFRFFSRAHSLRAALSSSLFYRAKLPLLRLRPRRPFPCDALEILRKRSLLLPHPLTMQAGHCQFAEGGCGKAKIWLPVCLPPFFSAAGSIFLSLSYLSHFV